MLFTTLEQTISFSLKQTPAAAQGLGYEKHHLQ